MPFLRGLVTPSGVTVAVLGVSDGRFVVRTPCGNTATVSAGRPIEDVRVVIDPGHGGPYDSGAHGPNGLVERDLNLTLANAVLRELASRNISAATTRTGHYGTLLRVRAAFADALGGRCAGFDPPQRPHLAHRRHPGRRGVRAVGVRPTSPGRLGPAGRAALRGDHRLAGRLRRHRVEPPVRRRDTQMV